MSGWRGVTFSVGQGRGRWLSLTQLASLPEIEGKESRDRYLYSRQLDRQDDVISEEMQQRYDYMQEKFSKSQNSDCERQTRSFVLVAGVRSRAVGAGLRHSDLQDGRLVVGAGQQDQVVLKAEQSNTPLIISWSSRRVNGRFGGSNISSNIKIVSS